jgi:signal transduction histidine kinase
LDNAIISKSIEDLDTELQQRCASPCIERIFYFRDVTHESEVDRMKSEFLSTAAHERRTPMATIYGFDELLLTQDHDDAGGKVSITVELHGGEVQISSLAGTGTTVTSRFPTPRKPAKR